MLAPDASIKQYRGTLEGPLDPNVAIEVHADGDVVPAFDAALLPVEALDATFRLGGLAPSESALEVTWKALREDPNLALLSLDFYGDGAYVFCSADARAGRFVVPKEQFREVATRPYPLTGSSPVVRFTAHPVHEVTVQVGNYEVTVIHTTTTEMDIPIP